jgi:hypothetical protein
MMRALALLALVAAQPASAQRPNVPRASNDELTAKLAKGETLEGRVDGDLNGDGQIDTAFVGRGDDTRNLYVVLAVREETFVDHDLIGKGPLDAYPLGAAELKIAKGVLTVTDLVGGTSATQGVYRLRYDPAARKMRLIGLDAEFYSRTWQHDGRETSWNLLTGDFTSRRLKLRAPGGPYDPGPVVKTKKPTRPVYLDKLPDLEGITPG